MVRAPLKSFLCFRWEVLRLTYEGITKEKKKHKCKACTRNMIETLSYYFKTLQPKAFLIFHASDNAV